MDMRNKLGVWLSGSVVHALGDRYAGTIANVVERAVHNKWKGQTTLEAVIVFEDGKQVVVTRGFQFELMERFGFDTNEWVGARISIGSRPVERTDKKTGEVVTTWQKFLLPVDGKRHVEVVAASMAAQEPDGSDSMPAEYQDDTFVEDGDDTFVELEARRFGRGRK